MQNQTAEINLIDAFERIPVQIFPTLYEGSTSAAQQIASLIRHQQNVEKVNARYGLAIQLPEAVTAAIRQQQIVTCRNEIQQLEERLSGLREQLQSLEG